MHLPSEEEVISAVHSLNEDQLKPLGRVILKRLRENLAANEARARGVPVEEVDPDTTARIDPKLLRKLCETCHTLSVTPEEGKEYSVVPVEGTPANWVDVCSMQDPYAPELWAELASVLEMLATKDGTLPCGRYACAKSLIAQSLPCLEGLSLGQVCHVVQLGISSHRLLGHRGGRLVPFRVSDEWAKEQCALLQQPFASKKAGVMPVATWELTRSCLRRLLVTEEKTPEAGVMLSDVKRLFHRQFNLDLNETALGYTRVFDLLQDARLHDVCTVHSQGSGQVVVRRVDWAGGASASSPAHRAWLHLPGRLEAGARIPPSFATAPGPLVGGGALPPSRLQHSLEQYPVCLSTMPMPIFAAASAAAAMTAPAPAPVVTSVPPKLQLHLEPDVNSWELVSPGASPRGSPTPSVCDESSPMRQQGQGHGGWSEASPVGQAGQWVDPPLCIQMNMLPASAEVPETDLLSKGFCMGSPAASHFEEPYDHSRWILHGF